MTKRTGINYPKFKEQFATLDFEADPLPVICLFPMPEARPLKDWQVLLTDVKGQRQILDWSLLRELPRFSGKVHQVCQIFNWAEQPELEGVRLVDALDALGIDAPEGGYFAFYSADGLFFEGLPRKMARDSQVLLVFNMNGEPLPHQHGGPLRLLVPFLQGYKSVKWVHQIRAYRKDPIGIKRLLGHSHTALLDAKGQELVGVATGGQSTGKEILEI